MNPRNKHKPMAGKQICAIVVALLLSLVTVPTAIAQDQDAEPTPNASSKPTPDARSQPKPDENGDKPNSTETADAGGLTDIERGVSNEPSLTVREILVLQVDRYGEVANDPSEVETSLFVPITHTGRVRVEGGVEVWRGTAMPLGLITFEGEFAEPTRVKLDLPRGSGFFHAHWPNDALKAARTIDWFQLREAGPSQATDPRDLEGHWLTPMREANDRLWIRSRDPLRKERFLLYDASLPFSQTLELKPDPIGYRLINRAAPSSPPITLLLRETSEQAQGADPRVEKRWSSLPITGPWPDPSLATIDTTNSQTQVADTVRDTLDPLGDWLTQRGYSDAEVSTALNMVAASGIEDASMSLVYALPEGEIDRHVALRFKPMPDRVVRTALVVVNNVDPNLGTRLDRLVAGLGDDRWAVREASQRELESIGLAAISRVQAASNSDDPEVAFRARQILNAFDLKQDMR